MRWEGGIDYLKNPKGITDSLANWSHSDIYGIIGWCHS